MPQPTRAAHPPGLRPSERFMWITPDRVFYAGLLGAPALRAMGCVTVYVAQQGHVGLRLADGDWDDGELAVVPAHLPHQVRADSRHINVLHIEAETVDPAMLQAPLGARGVVDDAAFVERVRQVQRGVAGGGGPALASCGFDTLFFGAPLPARRLDTRIQAVVDAIKRDPAAAASAEACARSVQLSFSRFLHLFRQEVGTPFRSFRTWKRARSLLHHVHRDTNLAHVAQDTGYPDSTHFSHSIRQVYGLKPKDIFAGSRRLAIYAQPG